MDTTFNTHIGNTLRNLRKDAGLTQQQLADRMARPQSFVSKIERGMRCLSLMDAFAYASALDMDPADLIAEIIATAQATQGSN